MAIMNQATLSMKTDDAAIRAKGDRFDLPRDRTMSLRDSRGARVHVFSGALWITQDGDTRDLLAKTGDIFTVERDGVTVLYAVESARIRVEGARSAKSRLGRWWKGLKQAALHYFAARGAYRVAKSRYYRL